MLKLRFAYFFARTSFQATSNSRKSLVSAKWRILLPLDSHSTSSWHHPYFTLMETSCPQAAHCRCRFCHQQERSRATRNGEETERGSREGKMKRWGKWEKRKWILSLPGESWSSLRLMCWIDLRLFPLRFFLSLMSLHTLSSPHYTRAHTPGSYFIKNPLCYWLAKLPLNFHLALRLVYVPAPLVLSPKPLDPLLVGRSMAHSHRRSGRGADCRWSRFHLFLPLLVFCISLLGWRVNFPPEYSSHRQILF